MNDTRADRNTGGATFRDDALAGKVALVVGAASGIGAAIARALSAAAARVTATGATDDDVAHATCTAAVHEIVAVRRSRKTSQALLFSFARLRRDS